MSSNVVSSGVMVPLNRKITEEEREEWVEDLYDQGSSVRINYEGTLAYTDEGGEEYGIAFGSLPTYEGDSEFEDLKQYGLWVQGDKARTYRCCWYNGTDSDMSVLTLEEFLKQTKQTGWVDM